MEPVAATEITYTHAYHMSHPDLSEPMVLEAAIERSEGAMRGMASAIIAKKFHHMIPPSEWDVTVEEMS